MSQAVRDGVDPNTGEWLGIENQGATFSISGEPAELGGLGDDPRRALVQSFEGSSYPIRVPAVGDRISSEDVKGLADALKPTCLAVTPNPGRPGSSNTLWGYLTQVQRQLKEVHDIVDAAFVGDRFQHYAGNIVVMYRADEESGPAENIIGTHHTDLDSGENKPHAAGLNIDQAFTSVNRSMRPNRAAARIRRMLDGEVTIPGTGRPVLGLEKHLMNGATDVSPYIAPWRGNGVIPPWALGNSAHFGLAPSLDVPVAEVIPGLGYVLNRLGWPFWRTDTGKLFPMVTSRFQENDIVTAEWTSNVDLVVTDNGNVVINDPQSTVEVFRVPTP